MRIQIDDITAEPTALDYEEPTDELNARLARGPHDWRVPQGLAVAVTHYRAGLDLFFQGSVRGRVRGVCARCAEEYDLPLDAPFTVVLTPRAADPATSAELTADDLAFGFYEGTEVDLTPLVSEQTLLALPTRPLCREECRGLCPRCGINLNNGTCACVAETATPRLAVLQQLVAGRARVERSR